MGDSILKLKPSNGKAKMPPWHFKFKFQHPWHSPQSSYFPDYHMDGDLLGQISHNGYEVVNDDQPFLKEYLRFGKNLTCQFNKRRDSHMPEMVFSF